MKTYSQFITEAPSEQEAAQMAPGMSPEKRRAALERNARNQARRTTPTGPARSQPNQKALPQGKVGGSMQKARQAPGFAGMQKRPSSALATKPGGALAKKKSSSSALAKRGPVTPASGVRLPDEKQKGKNPGTSKRDGDWGKPVSDEWGDAKDEDGNEDTENRQERERKNPFKGGKSDALGGDLSSGRGTGTTRG